MPSYAYPRGMADILSILGPPGMNDLMGHPPGGEPTPFPGMDSFIPNDLMFHFPPGGLIPNDRFTTGPTPFIPNEPRFTPGLTPFIPNEPRFTPSGIETLQNGGGDYRPMPMGPTAEPYGPRDLRANGPRAGDSVTTPGGAIYRYRRPTGGGVTRHNVSGQGRVSGTPSWAGGGRVSGTPASPQPGGRTRPFDPRQGGGGRTTPYYPQQREDMAPRTTGGQTRPFDPRMYRTSK